jgi:glycosyltransferase involved in cell wall biosynthesis
MPRETAIPTPMRDVLIDVSRLIWRLWRGGLPTGVDRVCLAYLDHYRARSRAVVQRRGWHFVLDESHSHRLFNLLASGPAGFRRNFVKLALAAFLKARRGAGEKGLLYLNVGHTGLDDSSLGPWIAKSGLRAVFLIHDLIPILHPEFCRPGEQAKHERRIENALRNATGLVANSKATLEDIRDFADSRHMPMPRSIAAWIAGPPIPKGVAQKHFDRPHFIVVGTIEGRKNHELLLNIWKRMAATDASPPLLVIVGQRGWEAENVTAMLDHSSELRGNVLEFGSCSDEQLSAMIAGARGLLMPSFSEGFGLPVVEALQLGTPVIASDLPVFREIAGDLPTYVDCGDESAWENAIRAFLADSPERGRQRAGMAAYRAPNWATHFKIVDAWIETLPNH